MPGHVGSRAAIALALVGFAALAGAVPTVAAPAASTTAIFLDGEAGNWLLGREHLYSAPASTLTLQSAAPFTASLSASPESVGFSVGTSDESTPVAGQTYTVKRYPQVGTGTLVGSVGGQGCTSVDGTFTVLDWKVAGGVVTGLAVDFQVTCNGQPAAIWGSLRYDSSAALHAVSYSTRTFDLGSAAAGTTGVTRTATITNVGSESLALGVIEAAGPDADQVGVSDTCPSSLAVGASCTVSAWLSGTRRAYLDADVVVNDGTPRGSRPIALEGVVMQPTTTTIAIDPAGDDGEWTELDATVAPVPTGGWVDVFLHNGSTTTLLDSGWMGTNDHGTIHFAILPPLGPYQVSARYRGYDAYDASASSVGEGTKVASTRMIIPGGGAWDQTVSVGTPVTIAGQPLTFGYPLPAGTIRILGAGDEVLAETAAGGSTGITQLSLKLTDLAIGTYAYRVAYESSAGYADPVEAAASVVVEPIEVADALAIEPALVTQSPDVTLHLAAPDNGDSVVRISLDRTHWITRSFSMTIPFSLVDPDAGGEDIDGTKVVWVQYGDGNAWHLQASDQVELDRTPPDTGPTGVTFDGRMWKGPMSFAEIGLPDMAAHRLSLDGTTWGPWTDGTVADLWKVPGAGTWWAAGNRDLHVQARDLAGNVGAPVVVPASVTAPQFLQPDIESNLEGVSFTTPDAAVTGRPFTIHVNYPPGYTLPSTAWCQWIIHWGDNASIMSTPNPTWGELFLERPATTGACTEWTFTIPYREARQFSWMVEIGTKNANTEPMEMATGIYSSSNNGSHVFRALDGSHDERFLTSTLPFAYVLPETTISQAGDPVTYRLHTVGTSTVPQSGMWWAYPLNCYLNPHLSQTAGTTFTYTPKCNGPWVTGWTGVMSKGYMRSQYDPLVDGRDPKVSAPSVKLRPAAYSTSAPATIKWSGSDSGSGVYRYVLEVSRNGGSWQRLTLPSRLTTSISKSLAMSGTYRFRVKARDVVGNWSDWSYGATVKVSAKEESSTYTRWSGTWTTVSSSALSGGKARATTSASAAARITISARSIAWVSRRGPGRGLAQVWVDGALATTVDLGAPTLTGRTVVFARSWSSGGTHTVRIVPLGTVDRPLVEIDAFLVVR